MFLFQVSSSERARVFHTQNTNGHRLPEATCTHAPTVGDQGWLVATDRQAGAVRGTLSPRTRGVSLGVSGKARRAVRKSKTEVKGKRPAPCACPSRGLGETHTDCQEPDR